MGLKYSWIAFDQSKRGVVEKHLDLKVTVEPSGLCGVSTQNQKVIIYGPLEYFENQVLQDLSNNCSLLLVNCSDTVSFSSCTYFENGKESWSVEVEGDKLVSDGAPPEKLNQIQEEFKRNETEAYYLIPVKLGSELVGIDGEPNMENAIFYEISMSLGDY